MSGSGLHEIQAVWWFTGPQPDPAALYQRFVDVRPDVVQSQANGTSTASGTRNEAQYRVQLTAGRIDFFINPQRGSKGGLIPFFADTGKQLAVVRGQVLGVCGAIEGVNRVAGLATIASPIEPNTGIKAISPYINLKPPFGDSQDVWFQINRRRKMKSKEGELNRLLRWSTDLVQQIEITTAGPKIDTLNVFLYVVDVNTVPAAISPNEEPTVINEVWDEVERLLSGNSLEALS